MKTVAIVQARMGSTRLPGKVLMDLGGRTVLSRVVKRLSRSKTLDSTVVATSTNSENDAIAAECKGLGVSCFRGSEQNVLHRYVQVARRYSADAVVRITADCPLIDPEIVDRVVHEFWRQPADYASNVFPRTYPRGLDTEVISRAALERAETEANKPHQREHVTPYLYEHPEIFRLTSTQAEADYSSHRWTLDTREDLQLIRNIYSRFCDREHFSWREVLDLIEAEPELAGTNALVQQRAMYRECQSRPQ